MQLPPPIVLEQTALGIILAVALVIFTVMSIVFNYHWKRFGIPTPLFRKMTRAYFWTSGSLVCVAITLFIRILLSL